MQIFKMKKTIFYLLIFLFLNIPNCLFSEEKGYSISGFVKDQSNGEDLIGAVIYVEELKAGTVTNVYGFYSFSLPEGTYTITYSYLGFKPYEVTVIVDENKTINVELTTQNEIIDEVVIVGEKKQERLRNTEMGVAKLNNATINKIPALFGEVDVIKILKLLPGVMSVGETGSGFNVRGGAADQNLILLDEAVVYNASHLLGLFSVFNNDAIKDLKLYKGDIPARYGGRLSSLIDIRMKDGNQKEYRGNIGIGLISSRLTFEGPIVKDKGAFIVSGRRTYADLFLKMSSDETIKNNKLHFYDLNLKANYKLNDKNRLFLSGYFGRDVFVFDASDFYMGMNWGNKTFTARLNHLFSQKLFSNTSFIISDYDYLLEADLTDLLEFKWESQLKDYTIKSDFGYYLNPNNTVRFGVIATYHNFFTGDASFEWDSIIGDFRLPNNYALEYSLYLSNEQKFRNILTLNYGLRFSMIQNIGPTKVFHYDEDYENTGFTKYEKGEIFNTYAGLEPRLALSYLATEKSSIKASYSRTRQYLQLASNSNGGTPLDIWIPASPNIKPQISDQVAVGYFRNISEGRYETSVELYYKSMRNQIDFKDYAELMLNELIEGELRFGVAKSYGAEFLIRKDEGKLTGWISYTLSKALRQIEGVNSGRWYNANYDKPHDISIVMNYSLAKRWGVSATWVYSTGAPFTSPGGFYDFNNERIPWYSDRNGDRLPDYHRMDLSISRYSKGIIEGKSYGTLNISAYNVYLRKNVALIRFEADENNPDKMNAIMTYIFRIIPSISYSFKF